MLFRSLEIQDVIEALIETGNKQDLASMIKIVGKLFPDYFSVPEKKQGTKLRSTLY